jgi:3-oxoadipate enol-lactonase
MRIQIAETALYCEVHGEGPPVLFVHGFPISGEMWRPTVERLGGRWRCIVPDLRGHGRSEVSETVTIARFADDLAEVLNAVGEPRPVALVGLSMGGIVAFEFFRRHRLRLRALVLCDTRASAETPEGIARREATAEAALRDGTQAVVDQMAGLFGPAFPAEQRAYWTSLMAQTPARGAAAAARALAGRGESFSTLPQIDCPTLVVAGELDTFTPLETLREIHRGIPGSRFTVIPNAGHVPPVEQPDLFAAVLRDFLDDVARSP